ncbi:PqqD family protein [Paracoccus sp. SM22M-07]|uniref:PqqD family protein n=1 Tax=Paracoccus sp. SM22M-07 TaxID=1520813 RepID=UPI000930FD24|nr:PqqD family protein [Paracoccus sp. SM22M-07]
MTYVVSPDCVSCPVEDGVAILDLKSNTYFSLDEVGTSIWDQMSNPASLDDLTQAVSAEYEVAPEECRGDIQDLLKDMLQHGLIQVV